MIVGGTKRGGGGRERMRFLARVWETEIMTGGDAGFDATSVRCRAVLGLFVLIVRGLPLVSRPLRGSVKLRITGWRRLSEQQCY